MAKKTAEPLSVPRRRANPGTRQTTAASNVAAPGATREPTFEEIAEAAYHRYLKRARGQGDGTDFDDWLEAERDLRSRPKLPGSEKTPNSQ